MIGHFFQKTDVGDEGEEGIFFGQEEAAFVVLNVFEPHGQVALSEAVFNETTDEKIGNHFEFARGFALEVERVFAGVRELFTLVARQTHENGGLRELFFKTPLQEGLKGFGQTRQI